MFATETLNRGLKKGFIETREKVVLLPTCMHKEPANGCKAKSDEKELLLRFLFPRMYYRESSIRNEETGNKILPDPTFFRFLMIPGEMEG